jgi:hypothetical protein
MMRGQVYRCAVSGLPFDLTWNTGRDLFRNPFGPSIDRRNSKLGYTLGNCRLVLSAVNYGINEWGEDVYRAIGAAVVKHGRKMASVRAIGGAR